MQSKSRKLVCILISALMCFVLCGFGPKNNPILDTEEKLVYEYYEISKIQTDASLGKNSNLVGKNVVCVGKVTGSEKNNKTIYIDGSSGKNVTVELPKALKFDIGQYALIYGEIKKPKDTSGVIEAVAINTTNAKELAKGRYTYSLDSKGVITNHCYNDSKEKSLNAGKIVFNIPNTWKELNGESIFNSELLNAKNAVCYKLAEKEYVGAFYFNYETFIAYDTDMKKKDNIECAIIQNICPGEEDRISFFGMKVPQKTFEPAYGAEQDAYVAVYSNYNVEFNFQEVNGGLFTIVYMYDDNCAHSNDLIYLLDSVKMK